MGEISPSRPGNTASPKQNKLETWRVSFGPGQIFTHDGGKVKCESFGLGRMFTQDGGKAKGNWVGRLGPDTVDSNWWWDDGVGEPVQAGADWKDEQPVRFLNYGPQLNDKGERATSLMKCSTTLSCFEPGRTLTQEGGKAKCERYAKISKWN
ncbi:hypothetical protein Pmani_012893 [Petrolisthes manimaculis]|uniref:Uncharacterized protein n=1 Tax=Petrolisthes manimaculis TaxID=1843537 RepID=A0AAE1UCR7_9EUCA|nr:hypothetical protein Pmani_012893 [Petrolisthes manimaculis]